MPPDSRYLPVEMWLAIAAHLSSREVSRLARVCRTFAALAHEHNKEYINTLRLPVRVIVNRSTMHMYRDEDESVSVQNFVRTVKQTMCVLRSSMPLGPDQVHHHSNCGRATRVTKLVLFTADFLMIEAPQSNSILGQLSQFFVRWSSSQDLHYLFKHFTSLNTLTILFHFSTPTLSELYTPVIGTTWMAFSANLRELNISADTLPMLQLSGAGSTFALPQLQVMRFSYQRRKPNESDEATFQRLAHMYTSSTKLKTLELRFNILPSLSTHLLRTLLPPTNSIAALETFSLSAMTSAEFQIRFAEVVLAFIKPHLATLVQFGLHCPSAVFGELMSSRLAFREDVAHSFGGLNLHQFNRLAVASNNGKSARLRDSTLELELELSSDRAEIACLTAFRNLCALSLYLRDMRPGDLIRLAATTPQLAILRLAYHLDETSALKRNAVLRDCSEDCEPFFRECPRC